MFTLLNKQALMPIGIGILVVGLVLTGGWWLQGHESFSLPFTREEDMQHNPNEPPPEFATVQSIVDAITIILDTGHIVRYLGVRAPSVGEQVQCFGREAVKANESVIGKWVRLEEDPVLRRAHDGAWVRYVYFEDEHTPPAPASEEGENEDGDISPPHEEEENGNGEENDDERDSDSEKETVREVFVNERILEGGFAFPLVSEDMVHGERMLSSARFASATGKGLWARCEITEERGQLQTETIDECVIKGKVTDDFQRIYRTPECAGYAQTVVLESKGGQWFCAEDIARDAGFIQANDCPSEE